MTVDSAIAWRALPLDRVRLAFLLLSPVLLLVLVAVTVSLVALGGLEAGSSTDAGLARVGDGLALVIVTDTGLSVAQTRSLIANWGLVAPAIGLALSSGIVWRISGRVQRIIVAAHGQVESADRERQGRLQEVVHELRTPLAVMGTNLELATGSVTHGGARYLDAARRAVGRMSRTVDDLAGHGQLAIEQGEGPVDLAAIVETAVEEHAGPGSARGVHVSADGSEAVLVPAVDPAAIQAAVGNFMSNAVRLAPQGSSVRVGWGRHEEWGWIAVVDEGPGLPPHHHARAFERGWQGPHDRDRKGPDSGSGLGLTIARQLTEAQGGAVTIQSEEGGGAVFALWLPLEHGADRSSVLGLDHLHPVVTPWVRTPVIA